MLPLKSSSKLCYSHVNWLFSVVATLICFIDVKQSCMINPVVRKINVSHFKNSVSQKICIEGKKGQGYSTVSFQAKESIWKTNGITFKLRVYFARQNLLTTMTSYLGKRTLKWVQGNNSSQKYNNMLAKKLLPLTDEAFLHDDYTFMQNNG